MMNWLGVSHQLNQHLPIWREHSPHGSEDFCRVAGSLFFSIYKTKDMDWFSKDIWWKLVLIAKNWIWDTIFFTKYRPITITKLEKSKEKKRISVDCDSMSTLVSLSKFESMAQVGLLLKHLVNNTEYNIASSKHQ